MKDLSEVEYALDNFIEALQDTEEYINYQKAKKALDGYPKLKEEIDEFRRRNFELQQHTADNHYLLDEVDCFERQYETFREDPLVNDFLVSELAFIRLMQKVYAAIMEGIDF